MAQYDMTPDTVFTTPYASEERVTAFLRSVYGWMSAGLGITALVAYFVAQSPALVGAIAGNRLLFWGSSSPSSASCSTCPHGWTGSRRTRRRMLFIAYSVLTGVTFSFILMVFTRESIASDVPRDCRHVRRHGRCTERRRSEAWRGGGSSSSWA